MYLVNPSGHSVIPAHSNASRRQHLGSLQTELAALQRRQGTGFFLSVYLLLKKILLVKQRLCAAGFAPQFGYLRFA